MLTSAATDPLTGVGSQREDLEIESLIRDAENARFRIAEDWLLNRAFIRGHQWSEADSGKTLRDAKRPSWKKKPVVNEMFSLLRVMVAKLTAQRPVPRVSPAGTDENDRELARACEDLLSYFWKSQDMDVVCTEFCTNMVELGTSFFRVDWNPEGGDTIEQESFVFDVSELPAAKVTGELEVSAVSPFEVFVQPGARSLKHARWVAQVHMMHVDAIYERWNKKVPPTKNNGNLTLGSDTRGQKDFFEDEKNMARVIEYWERPGVAHANGRYVVTTGGIELDKENELPLGDFPFIHCNFWNDPERFEGITPLSNARSMQLELNNNVAMILEGRNLNTFGKFFVQNGSGIRAIDSSPGQVITYNGVGNPPQWIPGQPVSQQTYNMTNMFRELLRSVTGVHEASLGTSPGANASGRSIAFQAEEDNTKLGPTLNLYKAALKRLGKKMLDTWKAYASHELTYDVVGDNAVSEVKAITGGDIRFRDIEFYISSALSLNKEAKRQELLLMFQIGVIDQQQFRRYMEFADIDEVYGQRSLDGQRARAENDILLEEYEGAQVWEDHAEHLRVHLIFMKQAKFYTMSPEVQSRFTQHIQAHAAFLQGTGGTSKPQQSGQKPAQVGGGGGQQEREGVSSPTGPALHQGEQQAVSSIRGT